MKMTLRMLAMGLALLLVAGCNRQGPELPTGVEQDSADSDINGVGTYIIDPNAAFVGSAVDAAGEIATPAREFSPGQTVYISVPSKGRKLGSELEIFWFHADGISRKEERKRIEGAFTVFEFQPSDTGKYNTEVDVSGRPVGLVEFEVK